MSKPGIEESRLVITRGSNDEKLTFAIGIFGPFIIKS